MVLIHDINIECFLGVGFHHPISHLHIDAHGKFFPTMDAAGLADLAKTAFPHRHTHDHVQSIGF